jgi:uncharacterized caspase-like protein
MIYSNHLGRALIRRFAMSMVAALLAWSVNPVSAQQVPATRNLDGVSQGQKTKGLVSSGSRATSETTAQPRRVALVVGNGKYTSIPKLDNPANDAVDVCDAFRQLRFDEVICRTDIATRKAFREAVRTFAAALTPQTAAVFFYAGHGVQINGDNYLLPVSIDAASPADVEDEGLSLGYVLRTLEDARSSPNIVMLDACRDNPFSRFRAWAGVRGLARVDPPVGTFLAYSTSPNGVALDGTGRNGLFSKHLLREMHAPRRTVDTLFQVVAKGVEDEARNLGVIQVPYRSSSFSGKFCLGDCSTPDGAEGSEELQRQQQAALDRIQALLLENDRLRRQEDDRQAGIRALEEKLQALVARERQSKETDAALRSEIESARSALARERTEQSQASKSEQNMAARDAEIASLRQQIELLQRRTRRDAAPETGTRAAADAPSSSDAKPRKPLIIPSF